MVVEGPRPEPMRPDILQDRKCIHVKLDKDVHAALRAKLFKHNLSMQEVLDEFSKLVASGDGRAEKIIEALVKRKVREALEGLPKRRERNVNELDHDTLYDLIEEGLDSDEATYCK
jgi:hypothetical protein